MIHHFKETSVLSSFTDALFVQTCIIFFGAQKEFALFYSALMSTEASQSTQGNKTVS